MPDAEIARKRALQQAFRDCGMSYAVEDVEDFLEALRQLGYTVIKVDDEDEDEEK